MVYGIALAGGGWWDLFCSERCFEAIYPFEPPTMVCDAADLLQAGQLHTDIHRNLYRCFHCGANLEIGAAQ